MDFRIIETRFGFVLQRRIAKWRPFYIKYKWVDIHYGKKHGYRTYYKSQFEAVNSFRKDVTLHFINSKILRK